MGRILVAYMAQYKGAQKVGERQKGGQQGNAQPEEMIEGTEHCWSQRHSWYLFLKRFSVMEKARVNLNTTPKTIHPGYREATISAEGTSL